MFRRTRSRGGRGRRAAVDFVVRFGCSEILCVFLRFLFFERTRPAASMRPLRLIYLPDRSKTRPRDRSDRGRFLPMGDKASSYRGAYRVPLLN